MGALESTSYCPDSTTTLLGCDVNLVSVLVEGVREEFLMIQLKNPKEDVLR